MNEDCNSPFHKIGNDKLICKICNLKCKTGRSISQHILKHHHIHIKDYYDSYYKKENEVKKIKNTFNSLYQIFSFRYLSVFSIRPLYI